MSDSYNRRVVHTWRWETRVNSQKVQEWGTNLSDRHDRRLYVPLTEKPGYQNGVKELCDLIQPRRQGCLKLQHSDMRTHFLFTSPVCLPSWKFHLKDTGSLTICPNHHAFRKRWKRKNVIISLWFSYKSDFFQQPPLPPPLYLPEPPFQLTALQLSPAGRGSHTGSQASRWHREWDFYDRMIHYLHETWGDPLLLHYMGKKWIQMQNRLLLEEKKGNENRVGNHGFLLLYIPKSKRIKPSSWL